MDLYWEQVVENILGGSPKTGGGIRKPGLISDIKTVKPPVLEMTRDAMKTREDLTPILLVTPKKIRSRKKSKTRDDEYVVSRRMRQVSITSDEGIDISPTSFSTFIPPVIQRPQHHLNTSWTFWYSAGNKNLSWKQNQVKISTVSTIEQFWLVTSQLKSPSNIPTGHTFSVFRAGVVPDWEDVANIEGGRWMVSCPKVEREDRLDSRWLEMLFMMVGEHSEEFAGLVIGAEACVRKQGDRLEVWVKDVSILKGVVGVGRMVKSKLGLDTSKRIKFSTHKEDKEGVKGPRLAL
eukprot:GFUD01013738.1.p1 GENE.GFUD01013738.1~~GFUD01013738.1.p1  ORF type:complete len:292 (-),score=85.65 GFUD01013738.1:88-963(-)